MRGYGADRHVSGDMWTNKHRLLVRKVGAYVDLVRCLGSAVHVAEADGSEIGGPAAVDIISSGIQPPSLKIKPCIIAEIAGGIGEKRSGPCELQLADAVADRKSTRLNSSH